MEIERAGLVAGAVIAIAGRARHRVPEGVGLLAEKIGLNFSVGGERRSVGQRPIHAKGVEPHREAHRLRRESEFRLRRGDFDGNGRP